MESYIYNGKFSGNILIVGRSECGKTTFVQKLALNNFFGNLKKQNGFGVYALAKEKLKLDQIFHVKLIFTIQVMRSNLAINLKNLN